VRKTRVEVYEQTEFLSSGTQLGKHLSLKHRIETIDAFDLHGHARLFVGRLEKPGTKNRVHLRSHIL